MLDLGTLHLYWGGDLHLSGLGHQREITLGNGAGCLFLYIGAAPRDDCHQGGERKQKNGTHETSRGGTPALRL